MQSADNLVNLLSRVGRWFRGLPWRMLRTRAILAALALMFIVLIPNDTPAGNSLNDKVIGQAGSVLFNYLHWEAEAIWIKLQQIHAGVAPYLDEAQRSQYVVDYMRLVAELHTLEGRINTIYADPLVEDHNAATADLRQQRDRLRADVTTRQRLAEAIIETQIASVLRDEGFSTFGEIIPPVSAHITRMPMLLVVSPRDRIEFKVATNVINLTPEAISALEDGIDGRLDVSSLIVPLGGLGLYPTMVAESWNPVWLFSTVAHEWSHNYLYFFPLGLDYLANPETRIINETTATIFGNEIGRKTLLRFYSDFPTVVAQIPPPAETQPAQPPPASRAPGERFREPDERPPFDFAAEMHRTRVNVDALLAARKVADAEAYMRNRQLYFARNGYSIRKINQAFFAFYGGYQGPGGGAGGQDPIGPALLDIRRASPSLKTWLESVREITRRDALLALRDTRR